jgi:hypothetical protein
MKKFIVNEGEKNRILNLHKKLISEQQSVEKEGEVSASFFEQNKIGDYSEETTSAETTTTPTSVGSSSKPKCPPITDAEITKQFEDDNSLLKYPNDKNYRYKKIGEDWFAKNINNKKVFNITKCGYTSSVEKLNKEFPNKSESEPITTTTVDSTKAAQGEIPKTTRLATNDFAKIPNPGQ